MLEKEKSDKKFEKKTKKDLTRPTLLEITDLPTNQDLVRPCEKSSRPEPTKSPPLRYRFHMKWLIDSGPLLQSLLLCIGIVFVSPFTSEHTTPGERSFTLPCDATSFMQSGDGAMIWFACEDQSLRKRWESDVAEAQRNGRRRIPISVRLFESGLMRSVNREAGALVHSPSRSGINFSTIPATNVCAAGFPKPRRFTDIRRRDMRSSVS